MDWFVAIVIVLPGILLTLSGSTLLIDYSIFVLAFNRGLRRIIDFYFGHAFNPLSPISLTPLVVTGLLIVPFYLRSRTLTRRTRNVFLLLIGAMIYAFVIGFLRNRMSAVFSLSEYLAPVSMMGFAATSNAPPQVADRWLKTAGWTAVGVAAYGWFQYLHPPVWDAFWMEESGMIGYLGIPEPTMISVFSTLSERGPYAAYLAWAVIPMMVARRWRNWTGWASVIFVVSAIPLSVVRTAVITVALVVAINPLVNRGRGFASLVLCVVLAFIGGRYGLDQIPGGGKLSARYQTFATITEDASFQGRLGIAQDGFRLAIANPVGLGLGSSGLASRINTGAAATDSYMDNGYFSLLLEFGWVGGFLLAASLWLMWKEMARRFHAGIRDDFLALSRSAIIALAAVNYVANVLVGPSLFWIIFGVALSSRLDPRPASRRGRTPTTDAPKEPVTELPVAPS